MYNKFISYPGGPNNGPLDVNPIVWTELNPYLTWMVNMATSIVTMSGIATMLIKLPVKIANPPRSSMKGTIWEDTWEKGTPVWASNFSKPAVPLLSFARP
jgi:hypothetical protein